MEKEDEGRGNQYERTCDGLYVLRDGRGRMLISTSYPAILFDCETGTLHKHGDCQRVLRIATEMRAKLARVGHKDHQLTVYASKAFDVDELNKCLSIAGYCRTLWMKLSKQ